VATVEPAPQTSRVLQQMITFAAALIWLQ